MTPHDLFHSNVHLVAITLRKVYDPPPSRVESDDLESAGLLALWKAAQWYDPSRGVKFTSYAVTCIRFAMREHLRSDAWGTRHPYSHPGSVPDLVSLDMLMDGPGGGRLDRLADPRPTPEEQMFPPERNQKARDLAARLLWALPKKHRRLLWLSVGLGLGTRDIAERIDRDDSTARVNVGKALEAARAVAAGW